MRLLVFLVALAAAARMAHAEPARTAYVDNVAIYGEAGAADARAFVARVVRDAGFRAEMAPSDAEPCPVPAAECLRRRGLAAGAEIAVRATVLDLAGVVSVELEALRIADGRTWRHGARAVDLAGGDERLSLALASGPGARPADGGSATRVAAWSATAVAAGLAIGGGVALYRARALRRDFFTDHVDASGDVVGISMAAAEQAEARAQRWALAGTLLLTGAGAAGVTAGILFARGGGERAEPAGLVVGGTF